MKQTITLAGAFTIGAAVESPGTGSDDLRVDLATRLPAAVAHASERPRDHVCGRGEQTFEIDGVGTKVVKAGEAIYTPPNTPHFGRNATGAPSWLDPEVLRRGEKHRRYSALSLIAQISGYAQ